MFVKLSLSSGDIRSGGRTPGAGSRKACGAHRALILPPRGPGHCLRQNGQGGNLRDRPAESKAGLESRLGRGRKGNLSSPESGWKHAVEDYFVRAMAAWVGPKNPAFLLSQLCKHWSTY